MYVYTYNIHMTYMQRIGTQLVHVCIYIYVFFKDVNLDSIRYIVNTRVGLEMCRGFIQKRRMTGPIYGNKIMGNR